MPDKRALQAEQYDFPYHYLVDLEREDFVRNLDWGLDYLTYMKKVIELSKKYYRGDILDVGCGDGYLLNHLARDGTLGPNAHAVGIDLDGKAIAFARAFAHNLPQISFRELDIAGYEDRFRLITSVETLEHIPDEALPGFVANIDRLLIPGGVLLISVPSKVREVIPKHFRHYDLKMLRDYFPRYEVLEVHYMTARKNLLYQTIAKLLANRYVNLNFGAIKVSLLRLHSRYTSEVGPSRGAHIVAAFRKP